MNSVSERLFEWSLEEVQNQSFHNLFHDKSADGLGGSKEECSCCQSLMLGQSYQGLQEILTAENKNLLPVNLTLAPVIGEEGIVDGVFTFNDMREQIKKEELLKTYRIKQEALARFTESVLMADSIDVVMNEALATVVRTLNVSYTAVCKYVPDENVLEYVAGTGRNIGTEGWYIEDIQLTDALFANEPQVIDNILADPHFSKIPLLRKHLITQGITVAIRDSSSSLGIFGVFSDKLCWFTEDDIRFLKAVSNILAIAIEQKRTSSQQENYIRSLWENNRALEDFASLAAYQLQAPLTKAKTFANYLLQDAQESLKPESQDYLRRLGLSLERMRALISALLSLSKMTRNVKTLQPVNLSVVVECTLESLQKTIQEKNAHIEIGILPTIECDASQMELLIFNLMENALKYAKKDIQPSIKIYAKSVLGKNLCEIVIEDNGIGFKPDYSERIFQTFERLHGKNAYDGTGIGLTICQRIVENHGGSIQANSTPGRGATFIINLPIKQIPFHEEGKRDGLNNFSLSLAEEAQWKECFR